MTLTIPDFHNARVVVAGDVMVDRYWFGPTQRVSPEAPVPVVRIDDMEERPGGGANVAVNLASLGVQTRLFGLVGDDEIGERLDAMLAARGIACDLRRVPGMPTVAKLRILSRNQQLIRLDFEREADETFPGRLDAGVVEALTGAGAVILSDYGKGALLDVEALIARCRAAGVPVLVDPKGTDFGRYRGATVITPNRAEFEAVVGPCGDEAELQARAARLIADLGVEHLLITRSDRGMLLVSRDARPTKLAAEAREVYDVSGAGDTVIAVAGAALALGLEMPTAAALANLAAGLVVRKLGVASVTPAELMLALHQRGKGGRGFIGPAQLAEAVRQARARGERVVMTNGCFDILHAGHISYLEEAKSLGDRLVVAINDDESVRRLKGDGRPINSLADRMAVIAGLAAVDWVVPFGEDTPATLISGILPDVLVKGGDYRPEDIAGGDAVRSAGGEVRVLAFRDGRSTSAIVDRIRRGQDPA
jgi:D-beta-D-heptose 7-phosphate kinase/D-beta-D-heptose 1-phosphate adenosyltransferase